MIIHVAEINECDPSNLFIVDLDKVPDSEFKTAVLAALEEEDNQGDISFDGSYSYGCNDWLDAAKVKPPCLLDAAVELYVEQDE